MKKWIVALLSLLLIALLLMISSPFNIFKASMSRQESGERYGILFIQDEGKEEQRDSPPILILKRFCGKLNEWIESIDDRIESEAEAQPLTPPPTPLPQLPAATTSQPAGSAVIQPTAPMQPSKPAEGQPLAPSPTASQPPIAATSQPSTPPRVQPPDPSQPSVPPTARPATSPAGSGVIFNFDNADIYEEEGVRRKGEKGGREKGEKGGIEPSLAPLTLSRCVFPDGTTHCYGD